MDFLDILVQIHIWWRWVVLLAAVLAIGAGAAVWLGRAPWSVADRLGLIFTIALDIEVAVGLLDWLLALLQGTNLGVFFTVAHPLAMLIAVGIAHIARTRAGRAPTDAARAQIATLGFLASLVIVILAIPGVIGGR
jgi:hypothetical protein